MFSQERKFLVDYVNPLIGTMSSMELSNGNTYPAVCVPFGMHNWVPHTGKMSDGFLYTYQTNFLQGFKQTHQASLWVKGYGQFSIMPVRNINRYTEDERKSWYSHKTETASPYYYKVYLGDPQVDVEMAPTERAAKFRITYHHSDSACLVLDVFNKGSYVKILPDEQKIIGYASNNSGGVPRNFKNYFVLTFDKPFTQTATWDNEGLNPSLLEFASEKTGAVIAFDLKAGESVNIDVASSYISDEQALLNLQEAAGKSFEQVKQEAKALWEKALGRIKIEGATEAQRETFYSALYRMLIFPRKFYEKDKNDEIVHYSPYNGNIEKGFMYADNGFWDTFRTQFPFLNLMYPDLVTEILKSLENIYKESGWLPEWFSPGHIDCMIGSHSASIIADAYINGIRDFDIDLLYEAIIKNTTASGPKSSVGRLGYQFYNEIGYVPFDAGINQNVSRTLEYAYNDYCIAQLATALERPQSEIDLYRHRSQNYKNLFDNETGLMRPKAKDGTFQRDFNPFRWGDHFTEGNSWQYTWFVPHDVEGLASLFGGRDAFFAKMDSMLTLPQIYDISYYKRGVIHLIRELQSADMGQYAHFNEPMHHVLYMYNFGQPWKTQYWVRKVMDTLYKPLPDGYLGDEDNGQMSAWYVMSSLGIYPLAPCSGQYVFGSPLFCKVEMNLQNGKKIIFRAESNSSENIYIDQIKINGKNHTANYIAIEKLKNGAEINFKMTNKPNKNRGVSEKEFPYSFSR
jgi:predicted alpha-1,2-mannosidase